MWRPFQYHLIQNPEDILHYIILQVVCVDAPLITLLAFQYSPIVSIVGYLIDLSSFIDGIYVLA